MSSPASAPPDSLACSREGLPVIARSWRDALVRCILATGIAGPMACMPSLAPVADVTRARRDMLCCCVVGAAVTSSNEVALRRVVLPVWGVLGPEWCSVGVPTAWWCAAEKEWLAECGSGRRCCMGTSLGSVRELDGRSGSAAASCTQSAKNQERKL